jgi:DNA-binding NarL/FixJ family response regulator
MAEVIVMGTPIRIAILAKSPLLHEGLVRVLRDEPTLSISSTMFQCESLLTSLNSSPIDVVLIHVAEQLEPSSWRHIALLTLRTKLLALLRCWDPVLVTRVQRLGVAGIVTEDVDREAILKAIHEIAAGCPWTESQPVASPNYDGSRTPSCREGEVLVLIRRGLSNREIADRLCICERTVKSHVNRLLQKFQVRNRLQLALFSNDSAQVVPRGNDGSAKGPSQFANWIIGSTVALGLTWSTPAMGQPSASSAAPDPVEERLLDAGEVAEDKQFLTAALDRPGDHEHAYVRLVELAISERNYDELTALFARRRAFVFEAPEEFQRRVNASGLGGLRGRYNKAIQAAIARRWAEAERGFAFLLGDGTFHASSAAWMFRVAMQQRDFLKARFLADLVRDAPDDPGTSADVLAACALQRLDQRQSALGHLIRELGRRGAYDAPIERRVAEQRAVYLAMIRLHNDLDQCFLRGMRSPTEARPVFPDLPDQVLAYLARRAP